MHIEVIRAAVQRLPFEPFQFRLVDGRAVPIKHPDFVAIAKREITIVNSRDGSKMVIEPLLIVSLDFNKSSQDELT